MVKTTKKYRPINTAGWVFVIVGFGVLSLLKADSPTGQWVGYQILVAIGTGILVRISSSNLRIIWGR